MKEISSLPTTAKQPEAKCTLPQKCNSTKCIDQRKFIIKHLMKHPCSTNYFRAKGISAPASRVKELRKKGNIIETHYIEDYPKKIS
jgi:hypothetical protein